MSDKPQNQDPDFNAGDEDSGRPPRPEQIWPPPQPQPKREEDEADADAIDLGWEGVEKIDDAIEEIRNGGAAPSATKSAASRAPTTGQLTCRVRPKSEGEMGQLWSNIFFSGDQAPPKAIIVTAAHRGDGATQIAAGLALIGAQAHPELKIALVDFNLRHPDLADQLDISAEPGLTDVLSGRMMLDKAMQVLSIEGGGALHVLPAGPVVDQPLGLVKSRQVKALITRLKDKYDHVILDVANANNNPDPQVLGTMVDGALLVVEAGRTPRETVSEVKKRLDLAGVRCLGLVLNQRSDPIPSLVYRMT